MCYAGGRAMRQAVQVRELPEQDADHAAPGVRKAVPCSKAVRQRGRWHVAEPAAAAAAARHPAAARHAHRTVRLSPPRAPLCVKSCRSHERFAGKALCVLHVCNQVQTAHCLCRESPSPGILRTCDEQRTKFPKEAHALRN